jgi:hypothetical protein
MSDDPLLRLQYLRETGQTAEAQRYEQYLRETNQYRDAPNHDYHAEFKSGALQKRMQAANARDVQSATEEDNAQPGYVDRLATHVLNTGQGIPGVEAVEAGAGALGSKLTRHPMSYGQSLAQLRENTGNIGGVVSAGEKMVGGLATMPFLPASPLKAGAVIGAADQALSADPESDLTSRAWRTAGGAAAGAAVGKGLESAVTLGRAVRAPMSEAVIALRERLRDKAAQLGYSKALTEGVGRTNTPQIRAWLAQPDVAEIHQNLLQNREFQGMAPTDPRVLDAVYKVHSDIAQQVERGLDAATPNRPNLGRYTKRNLDLAKAEGLDAMSGGASIPGPMPSYRPTVQDFAKSSDEIDAVRRGQDILRTSMNKGVTTGKNLDRTTPTEFAGWASQAPLGERVAASEGVLGAAKEDLLKHPISNVIGSIFGHRGIGKAPALMRATGAPAQHLSDALTNGGMLGLRALLSGYQP